MAAHATVIKASFFPHEVFVFLEMEDWGLAATTTIIWFGLLEHEAQHAVFEQ